MRKFSANVRSSELQDKVRTVFNTATICKLTNDELIAKLEEEVRVPLNRKYSNGRAVHCEYLKGFVQGVCNVYRQQIWNEVEFCYLVEGVLYSTDKKSAKRSTEEFYSTNRGHELCNYVGNFYWKHTEKPFTTLSLEIK